MPIKIQDDLPAIKVLDSENIFVMTKMRAITQDIRTLKIIILNLMPNKIDTETQILRLLSNSPLQVDVDLLQMATHTSKNTALSHIETFYKTFDEVKHNKYDGMIVTGAPVELLNFEDVDYWEELCNIFEWSRHNVYSSMYVCWGAQAALHYYYGIPKYKLRNKLTGVFIHDVLDNHHPLLRGFDDNFYMPHSRNTDLEAKDIMSHGGLSLISKSDEAGVAIVAKKTGRQFFITGHPEYDRDTLSKEYFRDKNKGINPLLPKHYFKDDNPQLAPIMKWRGHANLLYTNWLNYYVYQRTPYNIKDIK